MFSSTTRKAAWLVLGLIALGASAFAQVERGTFFLSGQLSYVTSTDESSFGTSTPIENSEFTIAPSVGYFVADNIAIGLTLGYRSQANDLVFSAGPTFGTEEVETNAFLVGTFARYYWFPAEQFALIGGFNAGIEFATQKENDFLNEVKSRTFNVGVSLGATYFFSPRFAVELGLARIGYQGETIYEVAGTELDEKPTDSSFVLGYFGNNLSIGASWYLGR